MKKNVAFLFLTTMMVMSLLLGGCSLFGKKKNPDDNNEEQEKLEFDGNYFVELFEPSSVTKDYFFKNDLVKVYKGIDNPMVICGNTYYNGLEMKQTYDSSPNSAEDAIITYQLDDNKYKKICFTVGKIDSARTVNSEPDDRSAMEILVDGKQVWEQLFYAYDKPKKYTVSIDGAKEISFKVRGSYECRNLCFANILVWEDEDLSEKPVVKETGNIDFIDNIKPFYARPGGYTTQYLGTEKVFTCYNNSYNKGITFNDSSLDNSFIYYNLNGKYDWLNFRVGFVQDSKYVVEDETLLRITLDGKIVYEKKLQKDMIYEEGSVKVTDGYVLRLEMGQIYENNIHGNDFAIYDINVGHDKYFPPYSNKFENLANASKLISEIGLPYSVGNTKVYDGSTAYKGFYMADVPYTEGIYMESSFTILNADGKPTPATAYFVLDSHFKNISFVVGRVDKGHIVDDILEILGDGRVIKTIPVKATAMPTKYEVNVEGVKSLGFRLVGQALLCRGAYMVADIVAYTGDVVKNDLFVHEVNRIYPEKANMLDEFQPYDYLCAGDGIDAVRQFNGIYDGTTILNNFKVDGKEYNQGFHLQTTTYLSISTGDFAAAGTLGIGFIGFALPLMAFANSSEVEQSSFAVFNLRGQYNKMTFNVGRVELDYDANTSEDDYNLYILCDNNEVAKFTLGGKMDPETFTVDLNNCEQLVFWVEYNKNSPRYAFYDIEVSK